MEQPETPYGMLLFLSDGRAKLADQAATSMQREAWYRLQLWKVRGGMERAVAITRELDLTFPTPKQRELLYELRKIARDISEALEDK